MAHGIEHKIRVHQALHGYADGHRLLASSKKLNTRDQKTMLIMSDVSGAGSSLDPLGYLTGYPLPDSGVYAMARTWAAVEMARPGCVWTHTLLIDFDDLAQLDEMSFVERAFRRPSMNSPHTEYTTPLMIGCTNESETPSLANVDSLRRVLSALYQFPKDKILCGVEDESPRIALEVWAQQWPRYALRANRPCRSTNDPAVCFLWH